MSRPNLKNIEGLHYYFEEAYSAEELSPLHIFVTFPKFGIKEIAEYATGRDRKFGYKKIDEDLYYVDLRLKKRSVEGWLLVKEDVWLFYILSKYASTVAAEVSETWIRGMFPFISLGRIAPNSMYEILDRLSETSNKLRITDYLSKHYQESHWASQKNWPSIEYQRETLENKIVEDGNILDSVRIEFLSEQFFKAGFSKRGHITYYGGGKRGYTTFYRILVDTYLEKAITRLKSLWQKEAKISRTNDNIVYPIRFASKRGNFTLENFEKMITAVKEQPDYSVSVIHKGNPWLSISIIDRSDGSNSYIYGFDDKVEIIPMLKASPETLTRLEDLIYEVFASAVKISS